MSKLLNEEELRDCIKQSLTSVSYTTRLSPPPETLYGKGGEVDIRAEICWLLSLIKSQKKAFAKYVIGEDNPYKASFYGRRYDIRVRNNLRAEQRERAGL